MKRPILLGLTAIALLVAYVSLTSPEGSAGRVQDEETVFPENITQILELSCYDCHSAASKNVRAKYKLNFDKWDELTDAKKIGALDEICTQVRKGKMPPHKYLSSYPDRELSPEQVDLICSWIEEESIKLMGEK